jgi:predicted amidophosphoribosyltransferase
VSETPPIVTCSHCGAPVPAEANFCTVCGNAVAAEAFVAPLDETMIEFPEER